VVYADATRTNLFYSLFIGFTYLAKCVSARIEPLSV
jgi:hypothetical protein